MGNICFDNCPFCGGNVSVSDMLPKGYRVTINHKPGCAIEPHGGVICDGKESLSDFTAKWNARCSNHDEVVEK